MREISLHILDIVQNSVVACASLVKISVYENESENVLSFSVEDNGKGMDKEFLSRVTDPFTTSRTTRNVGLGIPFLKEACESTEGEFKIESELGIGTKLEAIFGYHHIDRQPLGDMAGTIAILVSSSENIEFVYRHETPQGVFEFDTREAKKILGDCDIRQHEVVLWIKEYIREGINSIGGENYEKLG